MLGDNLSIEARLEAVEILLAEIWGHRLPLERESVRNRVGARATDIEAAAYRSGNVHAQGRAAEIRAALERLID